MIKSLSIASYNCKALLKSLFCQLLVLVLMLAFLVLVFGALATEILQIITQSNLIGFINSTVSNIIDGSFDSTVFTAELNTLIQNLQDSIKSVHYPWGGVTLSYIIVFATFIVYRLFVSYTDVTVACQVEEFMTSNAERPFSWFLLKKQGRTWKFICLQMLFTLPLDIMILAGALGIYLLFLIAFNWWTIIPVAALMVMLYAVRHTIFAFCLPAVACEDIPTRKAFQQGLSLIVFRFWRVFWKTLLIICVMLVISVVSIMFVDNSWALTALLTAPNFILFYLLKCVNMVEYFEATKRPYFHKRVVIEGTDRYNRKLARQQAKRAKSKRADD